VKRRIREEIGRLYRNGFGRTAGRGVEVGTTVFFGKYPMLQHAYEKVRFLLGILERLPARPSPFQKKKGGK